MRNVQPKTLGSRKVGVADGATPPGILGEDRIFIFKPITTVWGCFKPEKDGFGLPGMRGFRKENGPIRASFVG